MGEVTPFLFNQGLCVGYIVSLLLPAPAVSLILLVHSHICAYVTGIIPAYRLEQKSPLCRLRCCSNVRGKTADGTFTSESSLLKVVYLFTSPAAIRLHRSLLGVSAPPYFNNALSTHTVLSVLLETVIKPHIVLCVCVCVCVCEEGGNLVVFFFFLLRVQTS